MKRRRLGAIILCLGLGSCCRPPRPELGPAREAITLAEMLLRTSCERGCIDVEVCAQLETDLADAKASVARAEGTSP